MIFTTIDGGRVYYCDICSMGTFVDDNAFAKQEPFPEGWVRLTSELWMSGEYRRNRPVEEIPSSLTLHICDCCWRNQSIDIAALFRKNAEKECGTSLNNPYLSV